MWSVGKHFDGKLILRLVFLVRGLYVCVCVCVCVCVLYSVLSVYNICVRWLESIPSCRQKSVTSNFSDAPRCIRLDADVTATDTTQARVAQHDIANIGNSYFRMLLHYTIKTSETAFTRKLVSMANKRNQTRYSETVELKLNFNAISFTIKCQF